MLSVFPVIQRGQLGFEIGTHLIGRPAFVRHVLRAERNQILEVGIDELSVHIAPFAVFLVE